MEPRSHSTSISSRSIGTMSSRPMGVPISMGMGQSRPIPAGQGSGSSSSGIGASAGGGTNDHAYPQSIPHNTQTSRGPVQMEPTSQGSGSVSTGVASAMQGDVGVEGALKQLSQANERAWGTMGGVSRAMDNEAQATDCYQRALAHNPYSPSALAGLGGVYKARGDYVKAVQYLQQAVAFDDKDGHTWEELAYCYLMINDLQNSYTAYQHALYHIQNPKDARLWYGIGLLYDCYGSYGHAIEAFDACLKMDPNFELDHEVRFRVGIINKQQGKLDEALAILHDVLKAVNDPAWCGDVWSQIGHVYELKREIKNAKNAYVKALDYNKNHAKALQQLGWLHYKDEDDFRSAIDYLKRASEIDPQEGLGWYLLGRCYMAAQKHELAYQAYEQAVNCDPHNPNVWCSLGVLYYQLHQNRDALDAYTRAIKLDPHLCEVWYNVGTLYDSCNQTTDALDAYNKAAELGASGGFIHERIAALMKKMNSSSSSAGGAGGGGSGGGSAGGGPGGVGVGGGAHGQSLGLHDGGGGQGGHRQPHHTREQMDMNLSSSHGGPSSQQLPPPPPNGLGNGSGPGNGSAGVGLPHVGVHQMPHSMSSVNPGHGGMGVGGMGGMRGSGSGGPGSQGGLHPLGGQGQGGQGQGQPHPSSGQQQSQQQQQQQQGMGAGVGAHLHQAVGQGQRQGQGPSHSSMSMSMSMSNSGMRQSQA